MAKEEKTQLDKNFNEALKLIKKEFGEEAMLSFDDMSNQSIETISTGSLALDIALGGGIAEGRVVTIYGSPSSGKSTIALQAVANAQKKGYLCAYLDSENALDLSYAAALGVDLEHLLFAQPSSGTECFMIAETLLKQGLVKMIVFDSATTMIPEEALKTDVSANYIGLQARLFSKAFQRITPMAAKTNCTLFFISQVRKDIGKMFGDNDTMSCKNTLEFYSSQIMKIWKKESPNTEKINGEDTPVSVETTVKCVKNKVAPPFKVAKFTIRFGEGVSRFYELFDFAIKYNLIEKAGGWYKYKDGDNELKFQGEVKTIEWLKSRPDLQDKFLDKIRAIVTGTEIEETEDSVPTEEPLVIETAAEVIKQQEITEEQEIKAED
jgi:recombination protein RecA